jgi:membrane protein YqaA with SNARE-associated domain
MRSFFYSLLGYFLTPGGLLLMAALDSSLIFFLPLGIDFAVIILAARRGELFWLYALLASAGSLAGAAATFWIGRKIGEHGLSKLISPSQLKRAQQRIGNSAAMSIAALGIIPPPFPFTAFVLTSGACRVKAWPFFATLAGVRLARFAIEAALAARYGRRILVWMQSTLFEVIVGILIVLAVGGTVASAVALWRSTRKQGRPQVTEHVPVPVRSGTAAMQPLRRNRTAARDPE